MELTPDILRTFKAAAQTRNFTQASKLVNRSQSAVSMQMVKLEAELGTTLFKRLPRGVELTGDGEALLKYANQLLRLHDEALTTITKSALNGRVRIGSAEDYASLHLPGILKRFAIQFPLVKVELYCDLSNDLLGMLQDGELDICLRNCQHQVPEGEFLREEPLIWIAPTDADPETETPLPLALFHQGCFYRQWATKALDAEQIEYRIAYSSPSISGILAAVKSGLAVAPVGASTPISDFRVIPEGILPTLPFASVMLHQAHGPENRACACLAQYIMEEFRAMPLISGYPRVFSHAS